MPIVYPEIPLPDDTMPSDLIQSYRSVSTSHDKNHEDPHYHEYHLLANKLDKYDSPLANRIRQAANARYGPQPHPPLDPGHARQDRLSLLSRAKYYPVIEEVKTLIHMEEAEGGEYRAKFKKETHNSALLDLSMSRRWDQMHAAFGSRREKQRVFTAIEEDMMKSECDFPPDHRIYNDHHRLHGLDWSEPDNLDIGQALSVNAAHS